MYESSKKYIKICLVFFWFFFYKDAARQIIYYTSLNISDSVSTRCGALFDQLSSSELHSKPFQLR